MGVLARLRHSLRNKIWHRSWFMAPALARRYRRIFGYWPNPLAPRRFNEKLFVRMAFDRRPTLTIFAGKLEARGFVTERLGRTDRQPRLLGVARSVADVETLDLPRRYIAKASHASGYVRIVTPQDPISASDLANLVGEWLQIDYGRYGLEWCYHGTQKAVVFEELLERGADVPDDIKLFCFNGRAIFAQCDSDRFVSHAQTLFDRDWNRLDVRVRNYPPHSHPPPRPALFDEMIAEAELLSAGIDYVRVDLFDLGDHFLVGELTPLPQGGAGSFNPPSWDVEFGRPWTLPPFAVMRGWRQAVITADRCSQGFADLERIGDDPGQ